MASNIKVKTKERRGRPKVVKTAEQLEEYGRRKIYLRSCRWKFRSLVAKSNYDGACPCYRCFFNYLKRTGTLDDKTEVVLKDLMKCARGSCLFDPDPFGTCARYDLTANKKGCMCSDCIKREVNRFEFLNAEPFIEGVTKDNVDDVIKRKMVRVDDVCTHTYLRRHFRDPFFIYCASVCVKKLSQT